MGFINLGTRNKGTYWEYLSAYSFLHANLPITKFRITLFLGTGKGISNKHCHHSKDIENFKKVFIKEFESGKYNDRFFKLLSNAYYEPFKELETMNLKSNFTKDNNFQLAEKFNFASIAIGKSHPPMLMGLYTMFLEDYYTDKLKKVISGDSNENISSIKSLLLTTNKRSFAQREESFIYEINELFAKDCDKKTLKSFHIFCEKPAIKKKFEALANNFGWFHMEYSYEPFTIKDYKKSIWKRIENNTIVKKSPDEIIKDINVEQDKFYFSHLDNPQIIYFKKLTYILQEFAFILDDTKMVAIKGRFLSEPLFMEVAKRLNVSIFDMLFLTTPEIISLLKTNQVADKKLVEGRKKCRAVILDSGKIKVYEGASAKKLASKLLPENNNLKDKEVKGMIIYPGVVSGKVIIINSVKDKNKFAKGNIMVSHDGSAELTEFLQQASAIVTDEGGMICHTAIIAREMKIPCIVGTKVATKVFKDGDMVKVDAERGIVKILKRSPEPSRRANTGIIRKIDK